MFGEGTAGDVDGDAEAEVAGQQPVLAHGLQRAVRRAARRDVQLIELEPA
ncbi:hypothetical protein ABZU32_30245 [Sphaerisporangium sp. NPDC005288]